jgi:DNA processing protein
MNNLDKYLEDNDYRKKLEELDIQSVNYPSMLKSIKKPPETLYALGNISLLNKPSVAIVGTRKPSEDGISAAKEVSKIYGAQGLSIISGLANGVDSIAMESALEINTPLIGVLPSSLDNIVPKSNEPLAEKILKNNGLLISEYPEATKVQKYHFINRNRIISGIAMLTVVIETGIKGGTMHTVNFAKEQKRPILVVDIPTEGNQKLINNSSPIMRLIN